jgi:cytoskeletal protein CcmA (bactofilin family)
MNDRNVSRGTHRSRASRIFGKRTLAQPRADPEPEVEAGAPARLDPPDPASSRPPVPVERTPRLAPARPAPARPGAPQPPVKHPLIARPAVTRPGGIVNSRSPGRVLVVGGDIRFTGEITACEKLIVEGAVRGAITETGRLSIAESGVVRGTVTVGSCEVRGVFEGELTVLGLLSVRSGARVRGTVRYAELMVERGGTLAGDIDLRRPQPTAAPDPEAAAPGSTLEADLRPA